MHMCMCMLYRYFFLSYNIHSFSSLVLPDLAFESVRKSELYRKLNKGCVLYVKFKLHLNLEPLCNIPKSTFN